MFVAPFGNGDLFFHLWISLKKNRHYLKKFVFCCKHSMITGAIVATERNNKHKCTNTHVLLTQCQVDEKVKSRNPVNT